MSCYIVNPENIAKIANFIASVNFNSWTFELPETVKSAFYMCRDSYGCLDSKKICKFLAIENYLAYDGRYQENTDPEDIELYYNECIAALKDNYINRPEWKEGRRIIEKEHIQLYKHLSNYIYQISEDETVKGSIYTSLVDMYNGLSHWIISNSAVYKDCSWS